MTSFNHHNSIAPSPRKKKKKKGSTHSMVRFRLLTSISEAWISGAQCHASSASNILMRCIHVMSRGVQRENIFLDDSQKELDKRTSDGVVTGSVPDLFTKG